MNTQGFTEYKYGRSPANLKKDIPLDEFKDKYIMLLVYWKEQPLAEGLRYYIVASATVVTLRGCSYSYVPANTIRHRVEQDKLYKKRNLKALYDVLVKINTDILIYLILVTL